MLSYATESGKCNNLPFAPIFNSTQIYTMQVAWQFGYNWIEYRDSQSLFHSWGLQGFLWTWANAFVFPLVIFDEVVMLAYVISSLSPYTFVNSKLWVSCHRTKGLSRLEILISYVDRSILEWTCFTFLQKDPTHSWLSKISSSLPAHHSLPKRLRDRAHESQCSDLVLTQQCLHLWKALPDLNTEAVWCRGYWQGISLKAPTCLFRSHFSYCNCNSHLFALWHHQALWESQEAWNSDIMGK